MKKLVIVLAMVAVIFMAANVVRAADPEPYIKNGVVCVPDMIMKTITGFNSEPVRMATGTRYGDPSGFTGNAWLQDSKMAKYFDSYIFTRGADGWWTMKLPAAAMGMKTIRFNVAQGTLKNTRWAQIHQFEGAPWYQNSPEGNGIVLPVQ